MISIACSDSAHHNLAEFFCLNPFCKENRLSCFQCLQTNKHSEHMKDIRKISEIINYFETIQNDCNNLLIQINQFFKQLQTNIEKLIEGIQYKYNISSSKLTQLKGEQISKAITSFISFQDYEQTLLNQLKNNTEVYNQKLDQLIQDLQLNEVDYQNIELQKQFRYEILKDSSIKEEHCFAMDFNKDGTVLITGFLSGKINVYNFNQEKLQLRQQLKEHKSEVYCLVFMKESNQFISSGVDKIIIIWSMNNNEWKVQQILEGHTSFIYCLITNIDEDLIISGGDDKSIKFWKKNQSSCFFTLNAHRGKVLSLSLNYKQNQLISSAYNQKVILISEKQKNETWIVKQQLQIDQFARRICFIDNCTFAFQYEQKQVICIAQINEVDQSFRKAQEVDVQGGQTCYFGFPQKFLQSKQFLLNKNGNYINVIHRYQQNKFSSDFSINFETSQFWGTLSNDGQYLVTWDLKSEQIQIRKYMQ
ncbi:unnamed protein product [Paramecium sonneborni]|uniref:WD40-repeat-containing domain n=1 Tax=Paramecium sonneborni TaxID=65129 RepID=A0A8S1PHX8_9CILI|nr:unnamed protein product [Paramecium sonneborni]